MNTTRTGAAAALAAAALIASLAGCAGTAQLVDPPQQRSTGVTDVAERRLWIRDASQNPSEPEQAPESNASEPRAPSSGFQDVAERRLWMR